MYTLFTAKGLDVTTVTNVTICKRLFLDITCIILTFAFDIRAELYLEVYKFDFLPRRILALPWAKLRVFIP